jgi:hypothetical protein
MCYSFVGADLAAVLLQHVDLGHPLIASVVTISVV